MVFIAKKRIKVDDNYLNELRLLLLKYYKQYGKLDKRGINNSEYLPSYDKIIRMINIDNKKPSGKLIYDFVGVPYDNIYAFKKVNYTYDIVKEIIENKNNQQYELISNIFTRRHDKNLLIKCKIHNHSFITSLNYFLSAKNPCPICQNEYKNSLYKTPVEVIYEDIKNRNYKFVTWIDKYENQKSYFTLMCPKGHEFTTSVGSFYVNKTNCPYCFGGISLSGEEAFARFVEVGYLPQFTPDEYINAKQKLPYLCPNHIQSGIKYITIDALKRGCRCVECNNSKGEARISTLLLERNIRYIKEYSFNDLIGLGGGLLRFDFAIFDNTDSLKFLIEYDGEYHFESIEGEDRLLYQKSHDRMKNEYCKRNNIKLIRIPFWQFDKIDHILDKWIKKYMVEEV